MYFESQTRPLLKDGITIIMLHKINNKNLCINFIDTSNESTAHELHLANVCEKV